MGNTNANTGTTNSTTSTSNPRNPSSKEKNESKSSKEEGKEKVMPPKQSKSTLYMNPSKQSISSPISPTKDEASPSSSSSSSPAPSSSKSNDSNPSSDPSWCSFYGEDATSTFSIATNDNDAHPTCSDNDNTNSSDSSDNNSQDTNEGETNVNEVDSQEKDSNELVPTNDDSSECTQTKVQDTDMNKDAKDASTQPASSRSSTTNSKKRKTKKQVIITLPETERAISLSTSTPLITSNTNTTSTASQRIDKFLAAYSKFASNATMTERGIKLIQWSTWLLSYLTAPPTSTPSPNSRSSTTTQTPSLLNLLPKETSPQLRKFYNELSMMRYVLRLYGMPLAWEGTRTYGSWAGAPPALPSVVADAWEAWRRKDDGSRSLSSSSSHGSSSYGSSSSESSSSSSGSSSGSGVLVTIQPDEEDTTKDNQSKPCQQRKRKSPSTSQSTSKPNLHITKRYNDKWNNPTIPKLANIMSWSMLFYHPLEHVAYFHWTMPKLLTKKRTGVDGNLWSAYSCQFWLVFIAADWITSYMKNAELKDRIEWVKEFQRVMRDIKIRQMKKSSCTSLSRRMEEDDGKAIEDQRVMYNQMQQNHYEQDRAIQDFIQTLEKSIHMNQLQMIRCAFFTLPCLNWAMPSWATDPLFSERIVNGSSWLEAVVCMYQSLYSMM